MANAARIHGPLAKWREPMADESRVVIWGAGSWGTALALHLLKSGARVALWVFEEDQFEIISRRRVSPDFLPGFSIPENLELFNDSAAPPFAAQFWVSVVPTQHLRALWTQIGPRCPEGAVVISASKGIENGTSLSPSSILEETLPVSSAPVVALSGPSFAVDLCKGDPTAVVFACPDTERARKAQALFSSGHFRGYVSSDRTGVELGGAAKNVIALACGVAAGLGFGPNAMAAIITRGLREIVRLGIALGAQGETFSGLSGVGDLVLTCTGSESRNRGVGVRLGKGEKLGQILSSMKMVAEGVPTTKSVADLARKSGVEMPITFVIERILFDDLEPRIALKELLARGLKTEMA